MIPSVPYTGAGTSFGGIAQAKLEYDAIRQMLAGISFSSGKPLGTAGYVDPTVNSPQRGFLAGLARGGMWPNTEDGYLAARAFLIAQSPQWNLYDSNGAPTPLAAALQASREPETSWLRWREAVMTGVYREGGPIITVIQAGIRSSQQLLDLGKALNDWANNYIANQGWVGGQSVQLTPPPDPTAPSTDPVERRQSVHFVVTRTSPPAPGDGIHFPVIAYRVESYDFNPRTGARSPSTATPWMKTPQPLTVNRLSSETTSTTFIEDWGGAEGNAIRTAPVGSMPPLDQVDVLAAPGSTGLTPSTLSRGSAPGPAPTGGLPATPLPTGPTTLQLPTVSPGASKPSVTPSVSPTLPVTGAPVSTTPADRGQESLWIKLAVIVGLGWVAVKALKRKAG